jgi:hypothetical protein
MPNVTVEIKTRLVDWLYKNHWPVYDEYVEGWTVDYSGMPDYQHFRKWLKKYHPELIEEWKKSNA